MSIYPRERKRLSTNKRVRERESERGKDGERRREKARSIIKRSKRESWVSEREEKYGKTEKKKALKSHIKRCSL